MIERETGEEDGNKAVAKPVEIVLMQWLYTIRY